MPDFDVVVVGAGPAGTFSALKCLEMGLNVLLMEKGEFGRHKSCGGVLPPVCADVISESLGKNIPENTMCSPGTLGLYYVPPSGRKNGGSVKNYRLLNLNRDLFDQWLCQLATESGVKIWWGTEFLNLRRSEPIQISAKRGGSTVKVTTKYLIGADGVHSRVRKQLYGRIKAKIAPVLQEHWQASGDFDKHFYAFLRGEVSPTYAYVIPKDGLYVVGLGVSRTNSTICLEQFKKWLHEEFVFKPRRLERREVWAIPYSFTLKGVDNIILAGDAAGFCNALSGEGIRLAIESGVAASYAVRDAMSCDKRLISTYRDHVEWIASFVRGVYRFAISLTDDDREEFVKSELARFPLLSMNNHTYLKG